MLHYTISFPKQVLGAVHLHLAAQALGARPLFVHFGSVASVYAGAGLGCYAGANDFLSWFAEYQRIEGGIDARVIEW